MKRKFLIPFIILPMLFSCGSNDDFTDIAPASESDNYSAVLSEHAISLYAGESTVVTVTCTDGIERETNWYLSRYDIVSMQVNKNQVNLVAKSAGEVYLTAVSGSQSDKCLITVDNSSGGGSGGGEEHTGKVTSITLDYTDKEVRVEDGAFLLNATVSATADADKTIFWQSSDPSIAKVEKTSDIQARVTPLKVGYTTITATAGSKSSTCNVRITEDDHSGLSIRVEPTSLTLIEGESGQLTATYEGANTVYWSSNNKSVATVDDYGFVKAIAPGSATITASISDGSNTKTSQCAVTVKKEPGQQTEYTFSQAGHLYLHYLRENHDYDNWAIWMWQAYPNDLGGSFWAASKIPAKWQAMSDHWMTNSEVGLNGNDTYEDENGVIVDIDLTNPNIICGKTGDPAPIVDWDNLTKKSKIGFLIVDQTQLEQEGMWVSDGSSNIYIKKLNELFPEGKNSSLHLFCIQGAVSEYSTESGKPAPQNPTIKDTTGQYVSHNDITDLKYDAFQAGVPTSEDFKSELNERPGTGYQIFVPSFADGDGDGLGDLRGIINKLDYLEDLGIDVLWLTPIQESDSYHGYDVTDYYKIDPKFGTMEDYQELIFKAHQRGMKVLMDMVINHTSKNNVLFTKSERAVEENGVKYRDMYLWKFKGDKVLEWDGVEKPKDWDKNHPNQDWVANYNEVNVEDAEDWYKDGTSDYYYFGKFGSGMAELNYSCQATRDYMTDMCKYWLSFGLDGFRLDAIKHIYLYSEIDPATRSQYSGDYISYDVSHRKYYNEQTEQWVYDAKNDYSYDRDLNVIFWKQFAGVIKAAYPNCFLVGENFDGWNKRIAPFYEAIDSQFDFSTYYHLNESTAYASGISAMGSDIENTLNFNKDRRSDHVNGAFTSNHDVARLLNHAAAKGMRDADNKAIHHAEVGTGKDQVNPTTANQNARWFAAITLLTPGVSWIYYGDELGMSGNLLDGTVDDHGNNVDRWYRQPMKWHDESVITSYTFSGLKIAFDNYNKTIKDAETQQADSNSMYNFFKAVCHAKQHPDYPTYGYVAGQWRAYQDKDTLTLELRDSQNRHVYAFINATGEKVAIQGNHKGTFLGGSNGSDKDYVGPYGFCVIKA